MYQNILSNTSQNLYLHLLSVCDNFGKSISPNCIAAPAVVTVYRMEGNFGTAKIWQIDNWPKIFQIFTIQIFTHRVLREYQTNLLEDIS